MRTFLHIDDSFECVHVGGEGGGEGRGRQRDQASRLRTGSDVAHRWEHVSLPTHPVVFIRFGVEVRVGIA